jgi:hypothetical protein
MKQSSLNLLRSYFQAIIPFCDQRKGVDLLRSLGYECDTLTADMCLKATVENKGAFLKPFASLADKAIASPKFQALKAQSVTLDKADGDKEEDKSSKGSKANDGSMTTKDWVAFATDTVSTGTSILKMFYPDKAEQDRAEAEKLNAQAAVLNAQKENKEEDTKNTGSTVLYISLGAIGFLIVFGAILYFVKKKK